MARELTPAQAALAEAAAEGAQTEEVLWPRDNCASYLELAFQTSERGYITATRGPLYAKVTPRIAFGSQQYDVEVAWPAASFRKVDLCADLELAGAFVANLFACEPRDCHWR